MTAELTRWVGAEEDGIVLGWVRDRGPKFPMVEEMVVAAPAVVADKSRPSFEENWRGLTGDGLWAI